MSNELANQASKDTDKCPRYPPLMSAQEIDPANRPRAWIDEGLAYGIREEAKMRSPNRISKRRHEAGIAGELSTGAILGSPINRDIYDDYVGDDGYDLSVSIEGAKWRVETKTVVNGDLELVVDKSKVNDADYFVLCKTDNPTTMVELVGWIRRPDLKAFGERFPGSSRIRVPPRYLTCFQPVRISSEQIRDTQARR